MLPLVFDVHTAIPADMRPIAEFSDECCSNQGITDLGDEMTYKQVILPASFRVSHPEDQQHSDKLSQEQSSQGIESFHILTCDILRTGALL